MTQSCHDKSFEKEKMLNMQYETLELANKQKAKPTLEPFSSLSFQSEWKQTKVDSVVNIVQF